MRSRLSALALLAIGLLAACTAHPESAVPAADSESATVAFVGPSGLEIESEQAARAALAAERAEAERLASEAAAQLAAEAAAAAAQRTAEEAVATQAVNDAGGGDPYVEGGDGYVSSDLEVRCSDGTATAEECFGPGSDVNGNGIADVNE
jgi:membrane protein involved in colicin uptake